MLKFIRPEFFDIFGLGTFSVLLYLGVRGLFFDEGVPEWGMVFMVVVGVLGLIVDGVIVYRTYLRKGSATEHDVIK